MIAVGKQAYGIDPEMVAAVAQQVKDVVDLVEVCLVIGREIFRGMSAAAAGMERATGDYMGMLATVITRWQCRMRWKPRHADTGHVALPISAVWSPISGGVRCVTSKTPGGHFRRRYRKPVFTTDTAAALRASEMGCSALLKGTRVDGVYSADPEKDPDAVRYDQLSYLQVLSEDLKVMDASAVSLARENGIPILVFSIEDAGGFQRVLRHEGKFTIVS